MKPGFSCGSRPITTEPVARDSPLEAAATALVMSLLFVTLAARWSVVARTMKVPFRRAIPASCSRRAQLSLAVNALGVALLAAAFLCTGVSALNYPSFVGGGVAESKPGVNYNSDMVQAGGRVFMFGGEIYEEERSAANVLDEFWMLDFPTGAGGVASWSQIKETGDVATPAPRHQTQLCASDDGRVFVIGGATLIDNSLGTSHETHADTWMFDLSSGHWSELVLPAHGPPQRTGGRCVYEAGKVLMFGGRNAIRRGGVLDISDIQAEVFQDHWV